jgi:nicotinamide riboside kinase
MRQGFVVALVGAESTGKTTLAGELRDALAADGREVVVVPEYLREFCDRMRRTPRADEQPHIAFEQTRRIAEAAATHDVVVADTTALMIAVYSDTVFGDRSLDDDAAAAHRRYDMTLLTALDLPWIADGHQRDGEHVREPVDARVRAALQRAGLPYAIVAGRGPARSRARSRRCGMPWTSRGPTTRRRRTRSGSGSASVAATSIASGTCCRVEGSEPQAMATAAPRSNPRQCRLIRAGERRLLTFLNASFGVRPIHTEAQRTRGNLGLNKFHPPSYP